MRNFKILSLVTLLSAVAQIGVTTERPTVSRTTTSTASITGEVMDQTPNNTRDFRTVIQQVPGVVDEVNINTGKKHVNNSTLRVAPTGWTCSPSGHSWRCNGQPINPDTTIRFAFESAPNVKISNSVEYELYSGGRRIYKTKITPNYIKPYALQTDLQNVLDYPAGVGAGDPFMVSSAADAYSGGRWGFQVDGREIPPVDPSELNLKWDLGLSYARDRAFFRLPVNYGPSSQFRFTWDNGWGDRIVDAPAEDWFSAPQDARPCKPASLDACQPRVMVGSSVCVCGCFADSMGSTLMLDGEPIGLPASASSAMIQIPLPDINPGTHVISWPATGQSVEFEAINLSGAIAQDRLKVGQSTLLKFQLAGTEEKLPIGIKLDSGGVKIQGGNEQTAYFNGGVPNTVQKKVLAVAVGDFFISYVLDLPPCPCGGYYEDAGLVDPDLYLHPFEAWGRSDAIQLDTGFRYSLDFESDSIVTETPKPPLQPGLDFDIKIAQLGLIAKFPGYESFLFEQLADKASLASMSNVRIGSGGEFVSGDAKIKLNTEFSTPVENGWKFELGAAYKFDLENFQLNGSSDELGKISFKQSPGSTSSLTFSDVRLDAGKSTWFGNATFDLYGTLGVSRDEEE
jgi:hypothetical protein